MGVYDVEVEASRFRTTTGVLVLAAVSIQIADLGLFLWMVGLYPVLLGAEVGPIAWFYGTFGPIGAAAFKTGGLAFILVTVRYMKPLYGVVALTVLLLVGLLGVWASVTTHLTIERFLNGG